MHVKETAAVHWCNELREVKANVISRFVHYKSIDAEF